MSKKKIAIACQGGGSQTAFTAGVLKAFFENKVHEKNQIVSLSGTSGGALCATLSWYSLMKSQKGDTAPVQQRLVEFWNDLSTQNILEDIFVSSQIEYVKKINKGMLPELKISPDSPFVKFLFSIFEAMLPRKNFLNFKEMVEAHIDFEEIKSWNKPASPVLLIGAANVLKGEFKKFNSSKEDIQVEFILASAAVPTIFPAVHVGEDAYWDGLFSDNPPTDELLKPSIVGRENRPDELWVIQINPKTRKDVPDEPEEIVDRRNEMIGNESLFQDLQKIDMINKFLKDGAFIKKYQDKYKYVHVHDNIIEMSKELQETLSYSSKLDRSSKNINRLIGDGEKQAATFLKKKGLI